VVQKSKPLSNYQTIVVNHITVYSLPIRIDVRKFVKVESNTTILSIGNKYYKYDLLCDVTNNA